jgi:hypothetical protein
MNISSWTRALAFSALALSRVITSGPALAAELVRGQVLGGGAPIAMSTVTLWEASANAPKKLAAPKQMKRADLRFAPRRHVAGK